MSHMFSDAHSSIRHTLHGFTCSARWLVAALAATAIMVGSTGTLAAGPAPVAVPATAVPASLTAVDVNTWLEGYVPYALRRADIAGAVVVVVKDGDVLTQRGFGYADVAARQAVDPALTLFRPGSVSKLFTWTAVMQMVEQGKLDLDADINRYLDFKVPGRDGKPITMRNLMQHTAGFEEQAKSIISTSPRAGGFEALLKAWVPERVFAPGSTPAYSNYGASLAAYIVERLSGETFDDYIERYIFEPLDMPHSSFRQPLPASLAPLMAKGYRVASEDPKPFEIIGPSPAGSLSSPGVDMGHFMIAQLQNGEYHGKRILREATAQTMQNSPLTLLPPLNRMELGFFETNINGREVIGHLGDTDNFHTSLHLFLKEGVGFYVSFNSRGKDGAAGNLRSALFQDFSDRYFPAPRPPQRVDSTTAAAHAALMSGTWANSRGSQSNFLAAVGFLGQLKVASSVKGSLTIPELLNQAGEPRTWIETEPFVWIDADGHDRLAAKLVDGKPVRFSFDLLSPFMVFDRVPWWENSTWLKPLLVGGLVALFLTALMWPVHALVRRSYRSPLDLQASALRAYRGSKIAAIVILAGWIAWAATFTVLLKDDNNLDGRFDALLWFTQCLGALSFCVGLALTLWNVKQVWLGRRRWPAKVWSVVLAISAIGSLWVAAVCKLLHFGTQF